MIDFNNIASLKQNGFTGFKSVKELWEDRTAIPGEKGIYLIDLDGILRIFSGRLSYDKGAAIIHTLRHEIQNDDLFFEVMSTFQEDYSGSTATGEDFKNTAEEVTGMNFDQFFDQWYYGEGYPIYDLEWYSAGGVFHLTSTQTTSASTPLFDMLLDLQLTFADETDTIDRYDEKIMVKEKTKTIRQLQKWSYGVTLRVGYKFVTVYAYYQISDIFEKGKGPEISPVSLGLTITPF